MEVIKRNGTTELVSFDKITRRISTLCHNLNVDHISISKKVIYEIHNKIKTKELDEHTARICASLITTDLDYGVLADRIIISNNHKNTLDNFIDKSDVLYNYQDIHKKHCPLISETLYNFIKNNKKEINSQINYDRDYNFDYFSFKTLEKSYLFKTDGEIVERIQDMLMRVSLGLHIGDLKSAFKSYNMMSMKYFIHATPTLFNCGTPRPQLLSCFLLGVDDSIESIFKVMSDSAKISKNSGGIGINFTDVREKGSHIRGTNGKSSGIVPFLKVFNSTARAVNQGGKRNGSIAVYLQPHHPDILEFLDLKKNHGDEEMRARDLFLALMIPDLFMRRVKNEEMWSLFSPDKCRDLSNVYGDEYDKLYLSYENDKLYNFQLPAREIWNAIVVSQIETGTPYILYKDHINNKSNQKNLGVIKNSNLCVSPDTNILTKNGYFKIKDLKDKNIEVWNGEEFSETIVKKTAVNQKLLKIEFSNGTEIKCTPYHKFYTQNFGKLDASELRPDMKIIKCEYPIINIEKEMKSPYTHGFFCGDGTYEKFNVDIHQCNYTKTGESNYCKRHQYWNKTTSIIDPNKCHAIVGEDKPRITLYDKKKELVNFIDKHNVFESTNNTIVCSLNNDIDKKYMVPINFSIDTKIKWFEGLCDSDGVLVSNGFNKTIQISSIHKSFLIDVLYMLQTMGCDPKISLMHKNGEKLLPDSNRILKYYKCQESYRLMLNSNDLYNLCNLGFNPKRLNISIDYYKENNYKPNRYAKHFIKIKNISYIDEISDTYCFTENKRGMGIFNGIIAGNCAEIVEYSDSKEYACCTLASISLPSCINNNINSKVHVYSKSGCLDCRSVKILLKRNNIPYVEHLIDDKNERIKFYESLDDTFDTLINSMPIIILEDYDMDEFNSTGTKHLIGGYKDFKSYLKLSFNYDTLINICDTLVNNLNQVIDLNYYPVPETKLSNNKHRPIGVGVQGLADTFCRLGIPFDSEEARVLNKNIFETIYWGCLKTSCNLSKLYGPYETFTDSPISEGIFQFDMWGVKPSKQYDWDGMRRDIIKNGIRNSLLVALMPTASTSQILGNNECFEPYTNNIYSRRTLAGDFIIINKHLVNDLSEMNLWNEKLKDLIIGQNGSVQNIDLPQHIKDLYKTSWELKQKVLVDMSADRGPFVCQTQSLNLFFIEPSINDISKALFYGWKRGVKTGSYYIRNQPKVQTQKFTISPEQPEHCESCSG